MIDYVRKHAADIVWAGGAIAVSAAVQLSNATRFSFWHDESFSVVLSLRTIPEIITTTAADVHPPLYYMILHWWMQIMGQSDLAVRGLSVVFLVCALIVLYRLLKRFIHPVAARWGIAVAALGPFLLRYGIEARMYTLATLLLVGSTWFLLRYIDSGKIKHAIWYTLSVAAALYTHYFTFPVVIVHGLFLYRRQSGSMRPRWISVKRFAGRCRWWLYSIGGAAILFLPWVPVVLQQSDTVRDGFWAPRESLFDPSGTLVFFQSNVGLGALAWWHTGAFAISLVVIAAVLYTVYRTNSAYREQLWLLAATGLLPLVIVLGVSAALPESSVYVDRYFSYFVPFWYGLLGVSVWLLRTKPGLRYLLIGIILVQFSIGIYNFYALGNYSWDRYMAHDMKETMRVLNRRHQPGEEILAASSSLYIYFDAVHYNQTPATIRATDPGYDKGNASIINGREDRTIRAVSDYRPGATVWLLAPRGNVPDTPSSWRPASREFIFTQTVMQKFTVSGRD